MTLCFLLYRYFPHGGQQRDFLRIALACQARGHTVRVYTLRWEGPVPEGFDVRLVPASGMTRQSLYRRYHRQVQQALHEDAVDVIVGFSKMPGLDIYYGADPCFAEKSLNERRWYYRHTPRYKHFIKQERAVFGSGSDTQILLLTDLQNNQYLNHYPHAKERIRLLPPGLGADRRLPADAALRRERFRKSQALSPQQTAIVQIGSGFRVKGLDRSLRALAALPDELKHHSRFFIVGKDNAAPYRRLARRLGIEARCHFMGGRDDVPDVLLGCDIMLHPAYSESAGMVLLEALVHGLPVLTTDTCGHAGHVSAADAGVVCGSPFSQSSLNAALARALTSPAQRSGWRDNALAYCAGKDFYALPDAAADVIIARAKERARIRTGSEVPDDTVSA